MNKNELKNILKPLIKECIREVIFEEGALSSVVSEVVRGMGQPIVENKAPQQPAMQRQETKPEVKEKLKLKRKQMMEAIGKDAYNGIDLFEGTTPAPAPTQQTYGALDDADPNDPGVDISSVMNKSSAIWSKMVGK
jgi:hypothetical protein